jgi:hypothetical protein
MPHNGGPKAPGKLDRRRSRGGACLERYNGRRVEGLYLRLNAFPKKRQGSGILQKPYADRKFPVRLQKNLKSGAYGKSISRS